MGRFCSRLLASVIRSCVVVLAAAPAATAKEVLTPAGWAGHWDFTITYRDGGSGKLVAVDRTADDLCPNEPLGLALLPIVPSCESAVSETDLSVRCTTEASIGSCTVQSTFKLQVQQSGETLSGSGEWTAALAGECGEMASGPGGQLIEISAARRGPLLPEACAQPASLVRKLVSQPGAVVLSGTPFAAFSVAALDIDEKGFEVKGAFRLAADSDGIDPRREAVKLQIGSFGASVPPGSFRLARDKPRKPAPFTFEGILDGVRLELKIMPSADGSFEFRAEGKGVRIAAPAREPVAVAIAVGKDGGTLAARMDRERSER